MDHDHYRWSPISERPALRWPDGNPLTLSVVVCLNHMEWAPPSGSFQAHNLAGGLGRRRPPDYARLTHREYGHRVGIFRVLDALGAHGLPPAVAMDALTATHYPYLVHHCLDRGAELLCHGVSISRMITSKMSEEDERAYLAEALGALERASGTRPRGWLGPEFGESHRTPALLAEAGLDYTLDWINDEQPYPMTTPAGSLYALPVQWELTDVHALWDRRIPPWRYVQMADECAATLCADGTRNGRSLVLLVHPWLSGQPFRIRYLEELLGKLANRSGVTPAQPATVVEWARAANG